MYTEKNVLVSVVVPVYNVSKYLRRCLDSCVFQTLDEIEIIIVNDCSPDTADAAIMEQYKADYPQKVRLACHEENQGLGGARNTGIKLARGKYVVFVDSDDYMDVTLCRKCYECAENSNSDIVLTYFYTCQLGGEITLNKRYGSIHSKNALNLYPAWAMLINKQLITKSGAWFPEKIYHEDNAVTPLWQAMANKIAVVEEPLYFYLKGRVDAITSLEFEFRIDSVFKSYDRLLENTRRFPEYFDMMIFYFFEYISNRLVEINSISSFKMFVLSFRNIYKKYNMDIESLSLKNKQILGLFLLASPYLTWDELYKEYLSLIQKYYLCLCSSKELNHIFSNKIPETVCVWGCGSYGTALLGKFGEIGFQCLVTDMSVGKIGSMMPNGSIVRPWNVVKENIKTLIVGVAGKYEEMSNLVDSDVEVFAVNG